MGVVLISSETECCQCGKLLNLRRDRSSTIVIYDPNPGTHFHKVCSNSNCSVVQYYGYYSTGSGQSKGYNANWMSLPWFVSSSLTAFSMDLLRRVDSEILIGQLSYKQIADIYNNINSGYDSRYSARTVFVRVNKRLP